MLKLGSTDINKSYLGTTEINKIYLGAGEVFSGGVVPPVSRLLHATTRSATMGFTRQLYGDPAADKTLADARFFDSTSRYPVDDLVFIYAGWGVSSGENPNSTDLTVYAGLEDLRVGETIEVLFSGAETGVIPAGENLFSDPVSISLPALTEFGERQSYTFPAGEWFYDGADGSNPEPGVYSAGLPSAQQAHNAGSLVKGSGVHFNFYTFSPIAALTRSLPDGAFNALGIGDSIMMGAYSSIGSVMKVGAENVNGGGIPFLNTGRTFEFLENLANSNGLLRIGLAEYFTDVFLQAGTNDLGGSPNLATMQGRYIAVANAVKAKGARIHFLSMPPRTKNNNTEVVNSNYEPGGLRDQINAWAQSSVGTVFDGYIDWTQYVEDPLNHGFWLPDVSDLTHPDAAGVELAYPAVQEYIENLLQQIEDNYAPVINRSGVLSGTPAIGETMIYTLPIARGFPAADITFLKNGTAFASVSSGYPVRSIEYLLDAEDWEDGDILSVSTILSNTAGTAGPDISNTVEVQGFNPAQVSGLSLFLNTFDETTLQTSSGAIDTILDLSGNDYNLTGSSTSRPTVAVDSFGLGKDGARWDGINDIMNLGMPRTITTTNSFTMFVGYKTSNPTKSQRLYAPSNGAAATGVLGHNSTAVYAQFGTTGTLTFNRTPDTNPHVVGMFRDKTTGDCGVFYDGAKQVGTGSTDLTTTHGPFVGRELNNLNQLQGDIAIMVVYNRDLTLSEKNEVGEWIAGQIGSSWTTMT